MSVGKREPSSLAAPPEPGGSGSHVGKAQWGQGTSLFCSPYSPTVVLGIQKEFHNYLFHHPERAARDATDWLPPPEIMARTGPQPTVYIPWKGTRGRMWTPAEMWELPWALLSSVLNGAFLGDSTAWMRWWGSRQRLWCHQRQPLRCPLPNNPTTTLNQVCAYDQNSKRYGVSLLRSAWKNTVTSTLVSPCVSVCFSDREPWRMPAARLWAVVGGGQHGKKRRPSANDLEGARQLWTAAAPLWLHLRSWARSPWLSFCGIPEPQRLEGHRWLLSEAVDLTVICSSATEARLRSQQVSEADSRGSSKSTLVLLLAFCLVRTHDQGTSGSSALKNKCSLYLD